MAAAALKVPPCAAYHYLWPPASSSRHNQEPCYSASCLSLLAPTSRHPLPNLATLYSLSRLSVRASEVSYRMKNSRWRPVLALETGGSPNSDGEDFEEDGGFLGRTRLGRLVQAAGRQLLEKLNSARSNSPTKIFLVLLGFYTANALATILGQTGDWDVLVAGVVVAAIEGIGMLMYRKPVARPPGRFQSLISMINFWKAGVCLGLFVDAFKLGS
ncbi:unnamed protein product [Alopecurus aequalis]